MSAATITILAAKTRALSVNNPEFENATRVHDWRNHVPLDIKDHWEELTHGEKIIAAFMAEETANNEEWD